MQSQENLPDCHDFSPMMGIILKTSSTASCRKIWFLLSGPMDSFTLRFLRWSYTWSCSRSFFFFPVPATDFSNLDCAARVFSSKDQGKNMIEYLSLLHVTCSQVYWLHFFCPFYLKTAYLFFFTSLDVLVLAEMFNFLHNSW